MISIAVIMTVHNRKDMTISCLSHLFNSIIPFNYILDVYLTDDGCTDGTPEAIKELYPKVNILKGDGTLYWNRGMYLAWSEAVKKEHDYYLWLNDDTFLLRYSLSRLIKCSRNYFDDYIIVGSTSGTTELEKITWGGYLFKTGLITDITHDNVCDLINGNIVLIPNSVYKKVGLNDPYFHHAIGDFDYSLRAKKLEVLSVVAEGVYGQCDLNSRIPTWSNPAVSLRKRFKALFKPDELNPFELFHYKKRHFGFVAACMTFCSNYIHVIFPKLWKN